MDSKYIINDKKTLQIFPKDVLVEKILTLQEYILELKENNNELINKLNENAMLIQNKIKFQELKPLLNEVYPKLLQIIDIVKENNNVKTTSKYYLTKVSNKKHGFLYYVRYVINGKVINSRWNTHTNDINIARIFAEENRTRILLEYDKKIIFKENGIDNYGSMYNILKTFYLQDSIFLKFNAKLNDSISEKIRNKRYNIINKIFIPFLRRNKIKNFNELTASIIGKFQFYLIEKGKSPYTIRLYIKQ